MQYCFIHFSSRWFFLVVLCAAVVFHADFSRAASQDAIITTQDTGGTKGSYSWIQESKTGGSRQSAHNMMPTIPGIRAAAYDQYYYILEGEGLNRVTLFDIVSLDVQVWQYAAQSADETGDALPWDMVFVSDDKAYLLRYGSPIAWIVDPLSETEEGFKTGELDLSAYDDGDGNPEMCGGVVVDGKAFILLKRLDPDGVPQTAYLAVIDTATDTAVDTGMDDGMLPGIPLSVKNPVFIQYLAKAGMIYVQGAGTLGPAPDYTGGIEQVDPLNYTASLLVDDGNEAFHPYGYITAMVVKSATDGFFIGAASENDNLLYHFNPTTGAVDEMTFNSTDPNFLKHIQFGGLTGGMALDQRSRLWVGNITGRSMEIINTTTNQGLYDRDMVKPIENDTAGRAMVPRQIVFSQEPEETEEDEAAKPSSSGDSGNFCFIGHLMAD